MLNGIYNNDNIANNTNYINKDNNIAQVSNAQKRYATSPFQMSHFIDEINVSNDALTLYQKEQDIKKFTNLALSDTEDASHLDLIDKDFAKGVLSPFTEDSLIDLLSNQKLWNDING